MQLNNLHNVFINCKVGRLGGKDLEKRQKSTILVTVGGLDVGSRSWLWGHLSGFSLGGKEPEQFGVFSIFYRSSITNTMLNVRMKQPGPEISGFVIVSADLRLQGLDTRVKSIDHHVAVSWVTGWGKTEDRPELQFRSWGAEIGSQSRKSDPHSGNESAESSLLGLGKAVSRSRTQSQTSRTKTRYLGPTVSPQLTNGNIDTSKNR